MIFNNLFKKIKLINVLKYVSVLVIFMFIIRNVLNKWLAFTDFTPFSLSFQSTLHKFFYIWQSDFLGYMNSESISYIFRSIFEFISFNHPIIAQALYLVTFFIVGYLGVHIILKRAEIEPIIAYIVPFFYIINPTIAAEVANGAVGILIIYSLIPFAYILFQDLSKKYSVYKGIFFSFIIAIFLINIQTAIWILFGFIFVIALQFITKNFNLKNIFYIALHSILGFFLNAASFFGLISTSKNYTNISYLDTFDFTYSHAYIHNLFRLFGNFGSPQVTLGYFDINITNLIPFVLILLITTYFLFKSRTPLYKSEEAKVVWFAILTLLFLIGFINLIRLGYFNNLILSKNLFIVSARNPQKLLYLFTFCYILLIGLSLNKLYLYIRSKKNSLLALVSTLFIIVILLLQNIAFLHGDFGLSYTKGSDNYYITEKYQKVNELLKTLGTINGYSLYLPFDYPTQLKTYWQDNLVKYRLGGNKTDSSNNAIAIRNIYENICYGKNIDNNLDQQRINYIILDKDPASYETHLDADCTLESSYGTPYIWGRYAFFDNYFKKYDIYYEDENYKIYRINTKAKDEIYTLDHLYNFSSNLNIESKTDFIKNEFEKTPDYVLSSDFPTNINSTTVENLFENINNLEINQLGIQLDYNLSSKFTDKGSIYFVNKLIGTLLLNDQTIYYSPKNRTVKLNIQNKFSYRSNGYQYINLIDNGSFETGTWNDKVQDCYRYDNNPKIGMFLNPKTKSDGTVSLGLESTRHFACASKQIHIEPNEQYLFSFDYQSENANKAGYYIEFNDKNKTNISQQFLLKNGDWNSFSRTFTSPDYATELSLYIYSYPTDNIANIQTNYDNFHLVQIPPIVNQFFLVGDSDTKYSIPKGITFEPITPTEKLIHITDASTPFYLAMSEAYHADWKLLINNEKIQGKLSSWVPWIKPDTISDENHFALDSFLNGWFIDTDKLCGEENLCTLNPDGTYDIEMVIEFWPQRYFYVGLVISGTTLMGCIGYLLYDWRKRRQAIDKTI